MIAPRWKRLRGAENDLDEVVMSNLGEIAMLLPKLCWNMQGGGLSIIASRDAKLSFLN